MKKLLLTISFCFFLLNAFSQIANQPSDLSLCDADNDGFEQFDLTILEAEIIGNQTNVSVSFYETLVDAEDGVNAIPSLYTNTFNPQTIFARVEGSTGNYDTTSFNLIVNPTPIAIQPTPLYYCDPDNDGFGEFDLASKDDEITGGDSTLTVTYYETLADAYNDVNAIDTSNLYSNVAPSTQTLHARVEANSSNCITFVELDLVVETNCNTEEVITIQNGTFSACGSIFTDSGGLDGNYSDDENYTITFCPDADGDLVGLNFTSFATQLNADFLSIYDGDSTSADLIGVFSGVYSPEVVVASENNASGCLTLTFLSNTVANTIGWMADVICYQSCQDITASIDSTVPEANENGVIMASNNQEVTFNASATFSDDGTNAEYNWDFGDGNTATGISVSHTFTDAGSYNVMLTAQDANPNPLGCEGSISIPVEITEPIVLINNDNYLQSSFSPEELVLNVLVHDGSSVNIFSSQVNGNPTDLETKNYGYFNRGTAQNFPFEEGVVLTTGIAYNGGNVFDNSLVTGNNSQLGDVDLENALNISNTNDAVFIKFNFIPTSDEISFRYLMASEEYDGSTECSFSDGFAFLLREVGTTTYTNLAVLPDGTPVNVTNVNNSPNCTSNPGYFEGYSIGDTNYNGRTAVLTASASVIPNTEYEIKLVLADEGDHIWDTAVFLEGDSFNFGNIGLINVGAFNDQNTNNVFDDNENNFLQGSYSYEKNNDGVVNVVNTSTGSFTIVSTDENDTYDVSFAVNGELVSCFTQPVTSFDDIAALFGEVVDLNFPVVDNLSCEDLAVYLINPSAPPRPGFEYTNLLIIENLLGSDIASGSVEFTLDENLEIISTILSNPNMSITTTATGFILDFTDLAASSSEVVEITLQTPVTVALGDLVSNSVVYITDTNDMVANNNTSTLTEVVVGSYDPNDKSEAHGPEIVYDDFLLSDEWLYYTVRFQNLGTAPAEFIRIEDALDSQLDETSFQMLRSSHDYVVTRTGSDLEWYFDNINLPAEQDDEAGSMGFVYFRIKPQSDYALGDVIPNTAAIYFDFNTPVITNTFNTTFVEPLSVNDFEGVEVNVFPNPATDKVTITLSQDLLNTIKVSLIDIQGKTINIPKKEFNNTFELNLESLNSGLYFIQLRSGNNIITEKLVVE